MIRSFKHKGLENFFLTSSKKGIQAQHAKRLGDLLTALNIATDIEYMRQPGFKLHPLHGNLAGHWAVSVNGNWRIVFRFEDGNAEVVDYLDYH